jgi:hypothetical protein
VVYEADNEADGGGKNKSNKSNSKGRLTPKNGVRRDVI